MPKKIIHIITGLDTGGAETTLLKIASEQKKLKDYDQVKIILRRVEFVQFCWSIILLIIIITKNIYHSNGRAEAVVYFMFDVTNTTTHKIKLSAICEFASTLHGGSTVNRTYATFLKLGNT